MSEDNGVSSRVLQRDTDSNHCDSSANHCGTGFQPVWCRTCFQPVRKPSPQLQRNLTIAPPHQVRETTPP